MSSEQSFPPSNGFSTGRPHTQAIEIFYSLGRRLYGAAEGTPATFLIGQAYMAFAKTLMSVDAYLRFVPSSSFSVREQEQLGDVSSPSTMARQVLEDVVSFIYLCEPNLTPEEEEFRRQVWLYHGATEYVESLEFHNQSHPDLARWRIERDTLRQLAERSAVLQTIERSRRGRMRNGQEGCVLHPDQILERRAIETNHYDLPRKALSNLAHFSGFSFIIMQPPINELPFFISLRCVARFFAEALEVFLETFPQTRHLVRQEEQSLIGTLRLQLRTHPS